MLAVLGSGALLFLVSTFRLFSSNSGLTWVREFNRILLGLLVMGVCLVPAWGVMAVIFDSLMILVCLFILRACIQAQGEKNE